jgi:putative ATP-dependent endonuclease of OLD family
MRVSGARLRPPSIRVARPRVRLVKLVIDNYRSIRHLALEPASLCALVGENSAGKSNILRALDLLLGERWPPNVLLTPDDFYGRDISSPIRVVAHFGELDADESQHFASGRTNVLVRDAGRRRGASNLSDILRIMLHRDYGGQALLCYVDENDQPIQFQTGGNMVPVNNEDRGRFPFVYVPGNRSAASAFSTARTSLLGRLLHQVRPALEEDRQSITRAYEAASAALCGNQRFQELERDIREEAANLLRTTEQEVALQLSPLDYGDLLSGVTLYVDDGIRTPIRDKGLGVQSQLTVALYRVFARWSHEHTIFGIEEPELFLHPHLLRMLRSVFQDLVAEGHQVIFSTHNPVLVCCMDPEHVVVVRKPTGASTELKQLARGHVPETIRRRFQRDLTAERGELFYSRSLLLTEGPSDQAACLVLAQRLGLPLDGQGVSVIYAGTKDVLCQYSELASAFSIPHLVVYDKDDPTYDNSQLIRHATGYCEFDPDIEHYAVQCLGVATIEAVLAASPLRNSYQLFTQQPHQAPLSAEEVMSRFLHKDWRNLACVIENAPHPECLDRLVSALNQAAALAAGWVPPRPTLRNRLAVPPTP